MGSCTRLWILSFLVVVVGGALTARGQAGASYAVMLNAVVQDEPAAITLEWPEDMSQPTNDRYPQYAIYRRAPGVGEWGSPIASSGDIGRQENRRTFTDVDVKTGVSYEYRVIRTFKDPAGSAAEHRAYGYVVAGMRVPLVDRRGTLVLVTERSVAELLAFELERLGKDLIGDGWSVVRVDVGSDDSVPSVKERIKQVYDADPKNVKAVLLFGHVPVPYSGSFLPSPPDGHTDPNDDHRGAWPADVFYADMDGVWPDLTVAYMNRSNPRGTNVPGDGKFDPSSLPSDAELQVGRVDLSRLPGTGAKRPYPDEVSLLKFYLDKDHDYRHAVARPPRKALVGDGYDTFGGRAYAASGYRNFAPMFGADNLVLANTELNSAADDRWLTRLTKDSFQWVFGWGGGSNTSISTLGFRGDYNAVYSTDLVDEGASGTFYFLFGSWFGDWDQPDNVMRTALLTKNGLAAAWSGRPHLVFHPMALGETLGYCIRLSQNNEKTYDNQIDTFRRGVHIALMGDPTLRLHPIVPPKALTATAAGNSVTLAWQASTDEVVGYHVYRVKADGSTERITDSTIGETRFEDTNAQGIATYMVRAIALERSGSGTYFNGSQGVLVDVAR